MLLNRKKTRVIKIGSLTIGGNNPIAIQSMTDTKTYDVASTVKQILALEKEGCEMIRVAVPSEKDVEALTLIADQISIPLIADIHFVPKLALKALDYKIAKLRINPGNFLDLCKGGHSDDPQKQLRHFKLLSVAGAYWRGDEKNKMLTRIYGTCFATKNELQEYLHLLEEARKRDHKKLGVDLDLFTFSSLVGPGLPLWTPRAAIPT